MKWRDKCSSERHKEEVLTRSLRAHYLTGAKVLGLGMAMAEELFRLTTQPLYSAFLPTMFS
jgi:hypothetical protein